MKSEASKGKRFQRDRGANIRAKRPASPARGAPTRKPGACSRRPACRRLLPRDVTRVSGASSRRRSTPCRRAARAARPRRGSPFIGGRGCCRGVARPWHGTCRRFHHAHDDTTYREDRAPLEGRCWNRSRVPRAAADVAFARAGHPALSPAPALDNARTFASAETPDVERAVLLRRAPQVRRVARRSVAWLALTVLIALPWIADLSLLMGRRSRGWPSAGSRSCRVS